MTDDDRKLLQAVVDDDSAHMPGFPGVKATLVTLARVALEQDSRPATVRGTIDEFQHRPLDIAGGAQ